MSLGQDIAAALPEMRAQAESLMADSCTIKRPNGTTLDPDTLEEVPSYLPVYSGKCRVQRSGALSQQSSNPGGYEFGVGAVIAQLPLSAVGIERDDVFEVTGVDAISDPDLVGFTAPVQANLVKTHATKRTLICEQVTS